MIRLIVSFFGYIIYTKCYKVIHLPCEVLSLLHCFIVVIELIQ